MNIHHYRIKTACLVGVLVAINSMIAHAGNLNLTADVGIETVDDKRYVIVKKDGVVKFSVNPSQTLDSLSWTFVNGNPGSGSGVGDQTVTYEQAAEGKKSDVKFTSNWTDSDNNTCTTTDKVTCSVIVPKFITPAGDKDPVNDPKDGGDGSGSVPDGANEFTFSTASTGKLTLKLKAKFPGGIAQDLVNDIKFEVDSIGNSTKTWDSANPNGKPTVNGDTITATVEFSGLPQNNSDFGKKKAKLKFKGREVAEAEYEVFFPHAATNHPNSSGGSPNWYHYWGELSGEANLSWGGSQGSAAGVVLGLRDWSYSTAPDKQTITIYNAAGSGKNKQYGVGEEFSGIDWFMATVIHEQKHVEQITGADQLVSGGNNTPWRYGWAWNQRSSHNHWTVGADGKPGVANTDDDSDGTKDNLLNSGPGELGNGDDVDLTHAGIISPWKNWPAAWNLPNPMSHPTWEVESDAINHADDEHDEHDSARSDWSNPGKNHKTVDKWDD